MHNVTSHCENNTSDIITACENITSIQRIKHVISRLKMLYSSVLSFSCFVFVTLWQGLMIWGTLEKILRCIRIQIQIIYDIFIRCVAKRSATGVSVTGPRR